MRPDAKEFKSVKANVVKVQKQKKLMLLNIKELFQEFQKKYPLIKIGLSKTFDLRSKWLLWSSAALEAVYVYDIKMLNQ